MKEMENLVTIVKIHRTKKLIHTCNLLHCRINYTFLLKFTFIALLNFYWESPTISGALFVAVVSNPLATNHILSTVVVPWLACPLIILLCHNCQIATPLNLIIYLVYFTLEIFCGDITSSTSCGTGRRHTFLTFIILDSLVPLQLLTEVLSINHPEVIWQIFRVLAWIYLISCQFTPQRPFLPPFVAHALSLPQKVASLAQFSPVNVASKLRKLGFPFLFFEGDEAVLQEFGVLVLEWEVG